MVYPLRYERVPHYCCWCGFIGHDDNQCEKKRLGVPSRAYDEGLRCSPYRKYENKSSFVAPGAQPAARRGLNFSSNAPSEVLGRPRDSRRNRRNQTQQSARDIPDHVDARDGFEDWERAGAPGVDAELSSRVLAMSMNLSQQPVEPSNRRDACATCEPPSFGFLRGRVEAPIPYAVRSPASTANYNNNLGSGEMIPALRNLGTNSGFSSSDSDQHMQECDSVLGKRLSRIAGDMRSGGVQEGALILHSKELEGNIQKKGKIEDSEEDQMEEDGRATVDILEDMEATGLGATGKLTGQAAPPRQEQ